MKHLFQSLILCASTAMSLSAQIAPPPGEVRYISFSDGRLVAIPEKFILRENLSQGVRTLFLKGEESFSYNEKDVLNVSAEYSAPVPTLSTFAFTHSDNDQVYADVLATIQSDGDTIRISADVPVIGKRLRPSFTLSEGGAMYVDNEKQKSGVSSHRFESPIIYTLANDNHWIYQYEAASPSSSSQMEQKGFVPLGKPCEVSVNYLTDRALGVSRFPTIYLTFGDGKTWDKTQWIGQTLPDGTNTKEEWIEDCTFRLDGAGIWPDIDTVEGCEIRGRGNSSWSFNYMSKNPYRIKFPKKQKQSPFNLTEDRQWVFIANKKDGSMTTNSIAQKVAAMIDAEALCHMIPVDLYINGHYRGSYCFTEKIGIADNSVAIDETKGCLLELDSYYDEDRKFRDESYNLPVNVKDPDFTEEDDERLITFSDVKTSFNKFTRTLKSGGDITKHMDMEAWAKFWLVNDLVCNNEVNHPKSCYVFNPDLTDDAKWTFGPAWDFDWACGYNSGNGTYFVSRVTERVVGCTFFSDLRNREEAKIAYYKEWLDFMNEGRLQELVEYIDDYTAFAMPSIKRNNDAKIYEKNTRDYYEIAELSKKWITTRANHIFNNLDKYVIGAVELVDGKVFQNEEQREVPLLTYTRNLASQQWTTLYLPFEIPFEMIADDYRVASVNALFAQDNNANGAIDHLQLQAIELEDGVLKANHPYLLKPKTEEAMDMDIYLENTVLYPSESKTVSFSAKYPKFDITGIYDNTSANHLGAYYTLTDNGTWQPIVSILDIRPYRFYLLIREMSNSLIQVEDDALSSISISVVDAATGIDQVQGLGDGKSVEIFDISGRRVNAFTNGVYIINGKKVVK